MIKQHNHHPVLVSTSTTITIQSWAQPVQPPPSPGFNEYNHHTVLVLTSTAITQFRVQPVLLPHSHWFNQYIYLDGRGIESGTPGLVTQCLTTVPNSVHSLVIFTFCIKSAFNSSIQWLSVISQKWIHTSYVFAQGCIASTCKKQLNSFISWLISDCLYGKMCRTFDYGSGGREFEYHCAHVFVTFIKSL